MQETWNRESLLLASRAETPKPRTHRPPRLAAAHAHIALRYCLETLYEFLEEKDEHQHLTHVVGEQRGKKEDDELELEFRRICDGLNTREKILPFEILFSDKKAMSSGLQLADLVARPIGLHVLRPDQTNRAFEVLKHKFFCAGGREKLGEIIYAK